MCELALKMIICKNIVFSEIGNRLNRREAPKFFGFIDNSCAPKRISMPP